LAIQTGLPCSTRYAFPGREPLFAYRSSIESWRKSSVTTSGGSVLPCLRIRALAHYRRRRMTMRRSGCASQGSVSREVRSTMAKCSSAGSTPVAESGGLMAFKPGLSPRISRVHSKIRSPTIRASQLRGLMLNAARGSHPRHQVVGVLIPPAGGIEGSQRQDCSNIRRGAMVSCMGNPSPVVPQPTNRFAKNRLASMTGWVRAARRAKSANLSA
jgi:hypothetical protein